MGGQISSHKRDVEIPLLKLLVSERFFVLPRKPLVRYGLGLCQKPWHAHCNRGELQPNYLNPSRPTDASH